jgi:putative tricarboxylic transport membrane protein
MIYMKNAGVYVGIVLLIYSVVMVWQSLTLDYYTAFGPGPGFFPLWVSILLLVLSILYLWESIKKEVILLSKIIPKGKDLRKILAVLGSVVLFMILVNFTGFVISGSILLFLLFMKEYKWYQGIAMSISISILLFYIFNTLLNVPLPANAFGW